MDPLVELRDREITLTVLLPGGEETTATVHGSKPVMDILVSFCAQHHLSPSDHVIKLISTNQNHVNFKPSSLIGSLEFEKVALQAKRSDDGKKKPYIPVPTVRLLINYKGSQKAVVRVNPSVPLSELMPAVCEKCEFDPETTILLLTSHSKEPLDLTKTLNDHVIRELYAKDMKESKSIAEPLPMYKEEDQKITVKEKNKTNKHFFSFFRKSKKTTPKAVICNAPECSELTGQHSSRLTSVNMLSASPDQPKKRRAPLPPKEGTQNTTCDLAENQGSISVTSSTESSLKRTKRKAPPPPCDSPSPLDSENKEKFSDDNMSPEKYRARLVNQNPAIAKVMSELVTSLQARQQKALASPHSASENTSLNISSVSWIAEDDCKAPPGPQLLKTRCKGEGYTTFLVTPSRHQYLETSLTSQEEVDCEQESSGHSNLEIYNTQDEITSESKNLINHAENCEDQPENIYLQLEEDAQTRTESSIDDSETITKENPCKNQKSSHEFKLLSTPESFKPVDQKTMRIKAESKVRTGNVESDDKDPDESKCLEQAEVKETHVEPGIKRDWMEENTERRTFLDEDDDCKKKLDLWETDDDKSTLEHFPTPPPPVEWDENISEEKQNETNQKEEEHCTLNWKATPEVERVSANYDSPSRSSPCSSGKDSPFALAVFKKAKLFRLALDRSVSKKGDLHFYNHYGL